MHDSSKTYQELIEENALLKQRIQDLEYSEAERKHTEEALKESEANYRQLFDSAPAAIYRVDFRNGKFLKANAVFVEYLGYSHEELTSLSPYNMLTEESKKLFLQRMEKMALGEEVPETVEYEIVDKNGKHRCMYLHNRNIYDAEGHVVASDVVAHDITERKQSEKALRESEERFRSLVEMTSDWVWEVDRHGIYTYVSPKVKDLLGYEPEEVIGRMPFDFMPTDEAQRIAKVFSDIAKARRAFERLENVNLHKDGHRIVLETSGVPVFGE
ncbi:MAG: PAS domain S-box protein, partial [Syntrophales bacterium LBB04]|nr:PAS domain S-box protein [Syntrophales bacterium LBB04]